MAHTVTQLEEQVIEWARAHDDIRALILVGSQARARVGSAQPADDLSDLDFMIFTDEWDDYIHDDAWLSQFGEVWVTVSNQTGEGEPEWMAVFDGGIKLDFIFFKLSELDVLARGESWPGVYQRGAVVLVDKDERVVLPQSFGTPRPNLPDEPTFQETVKTFWYGSLYVAKHIKRGDLWVAQYRDWTMKTQLLTMLEWYGLIKGQDVWHDGRFIETWADPDIYAALGSAFPHFDAADAEKALNVTMSLFRRIARLTAAHLNYVYPDMLDTRISDFVESMLGHS